MAQELIVRKDENSSVLEDVDMLKMAAQKLMQTSHYAKLGQEGIFAIIQKAKSLNINTLDALNGSLFYISGKVGMSAEMMNTLIRSHGHSITKDPKSDDTICILHGRRADTGDTWTESFSIADAKRAGIYRGIWEKYPRNMCFSRALSNLARQLFPDLIKNCYEIEELKSFATDSPINYQKAEEIEEVEVCMSQEDIEKFYKTFNDDPAMTKTYVQMCMEKKGWTESKAILGLLNNPAASHKAYTKWKEKQPKKEVVESVEVVAAVEEVK